MSLLVVGSVAYDTIKTPTNQRQEALGGSATYFSIAGSYFTPVSIVAVIGEDFNPDDLELFRAHHIDISGLEKKRGKTFRWSGLYTSEDLNTRTTLDTQLNVFADFTPKLNSDHTKSSYLFLANIDPSLQWYVLENMKIRPKLVALDTMNFWIDSKKDALTRIVKRVDVLFIDENEIRSFTGESNLIKAAQRIIKLGPETLVIKRGEHGVIIFNEDQGFSAPALPLENLVDTTGAGDSFAGGFMGYLAATGDLSNQNFRRAAIMGSVMGSLAVESFSVDRLRNLTQIDVETRFKLFEQLTQFKFMTQGESIPWRTPDNTRIT